MKRFYSGVILAILFALFQFESPLSLAEEYRPDIKGKSNEGELALEAFKVPDFLKVRLWAAEPMLANPVAFCIDEQGRLYVCETFRQQKGVEDNRSHMTWLEDDLSLTTVEERLEMFQKHLGESVKDYAKEQDRIRLLSDTDHDGRADESKIFAEGFNGILDGTGAGVLAVDGEVYYTCIPDLYKLSDSNSDGQADVKESLHHGYGVRVAFRGHDMHGLIMGPDGRLYFSIGDRGYNVLTKEGEHLVRPDTGAVFRCELDGSKLEVFAYGLRNPQELAFDDHGNLFTGDNNSDSGDQARWVYVTEGSDTGWRMYFQYLSDRGPWNRERMWYPYRADEQTSEVQPAYIVPPIVNISDGPSGLVCYPGIGFGPEYQGRFFLADFRGTSGRSGIRQFHVTPKGATFDFVDDGWLLQSILATDVDFGYDGKMYVTDWVDGWNGPGKGRVYTFEHTSPQQFEGVRSSAEIMAQDFQKLSREELASMCGHPDRRVRLRSQFELVRQGATAELRSLAESGEDEVSRLHGVWGLGQLLRHGKTSPAPLLTLLNDANAEVRAQAIKVLSDARTEDAFVGLVQAVEKGTPREQYFAAIGLGHLKKAEASAPLIDMLKRNDNADPALRHAGIMGLTGSLNAKQLSELSNVGTPEAVRLAVVVALRRHESPLLKTFLNDPSVDIIVEAARAIHDLDIQAALPDLAQLRISSSTPDALVRRVMSANFRLGKEENARIVAAFAANQDLSPALRKEAISELLMWDNPPVLDRVINIYRPLPARSLELARSAVRDHLGAMMVGDKDLKTAAIKLAAKYEIQDIASYLVSTFKNLENDPQMRVEAINALATVGTDELDNLLVAATNDGNDEVRTIGRRLLARRQPQLVIPQLSEVLKSGTKIERQGAVETLASINGPEADAVLLEALDSYVRGEISPEIKLDLLMVAEKKESDAFRERLAKIEARRDSSSPLAAYEECLEGGDLKRGIEVFFGNAAASCRRCHKVNGNGSDVGPDLSAVSKENPRSYLLESIVAPNAKIAKGFETIVFAMDDGRIVSGIVKSEDDSTYQLMKATGELVVITKSEVDAQAKGQSGMPADMAKQLSKSDIRNLVEYLSTLKTPYRPEGHE